MYATLKIKKEMKNWYHKSYIEMSSDCSFFGFVVSTFYISPIKYRKKENILNRYGIQSYFFKNDITILTFSFFIGWFYG